MNNDVLLDHLIRTITTCSDETTRFFSSHNTQNNTLTVNRQNSFGSEKALRSWFDTLNIHFDETKQTLFVHFPHVFFGTHFMKFFKLPFEIAAKQIWGKNISIRYSNLEKSDSIYLKQSGKNCFSPNKKLPYSKDYTFDTFISNNKHIVLMNFIEQSIQKIIYNSASIEKDISQILVLYGLHGTGKTHILCAIANEMFDALGDDILYTSPDNLKQLFISLPSSIVRNQLYGKKVFLLDDINTLPMVENTIDETDYFEGRYHKNISLQKELCLIYDIFEKQHKLFIVAGTDNPKNWHIDAHLLSRLKYGLWINLPKPDLDIRLQYIRRKTQLHPIFHEHALLLAQQCPDMSILSTVLQKIILHNSLYSVDISEQNIMDFIHEAGEHTNLLPQHIINIVSKHCGVSARDILSEKKRQRIVQARQLTMYLCRELLGYSYPVIGRILGGKDHSTVMHGVKKIKLLQNNDTVTHTLVTELTKKCLESFR